LVNAAFALWTVDLIFAPLRQGRQESDRAAALDAAADLSASTPQRFNANAVLLATWPLRHLLLPALV